MFIYKIDVMKALKEKGYKQTDLIRDKVISPSSITKIARGQNITLETLNTICLLLRLQPGDIIEIVPTDQEKIKYY